MAQEPKQPGGKFQRSEILLAIVCIVPAIYWAATYSGPYRWIAELQLRMMGMYEGSITFVLTMFVALIPLLVVKAAVKKLGVAMEGGEEADSAWWGRVSHYFSDLVVMVIGLVFLGVGVVAYLRVKGESGPTAIDVRELEGGKKVGKLWLEVSGMALVEEASSIKKNYNTDNYVPVVSRDWKKGEPIAVYLEVDESEFGEGLKKPEGGKYKGMVTVGGLPGMAREDLRRRGFGPAEGYVMLEYNSTPADVQRGARFMLIAGGAVSVVGLGMVGYRKWRMGRIGPADSPPVASQLRIKQIVPLDNRPPSQ